MLSKARNAAARHRASGGAGRLFQLGGFDRGADLSPVQRIVEAEITAVLTLFGEGAVEEREMTFGRAIAQHRQLETVERIEDSPALAQGPGASFGTANALKSKKSRNT